MPALINRVIVILIAAASLAGMPTAVSASADKSFETFGRGVLVGTQLKIDPENLEGHLPRGFEPPLDPAGLATLQVEFFRIDPFTVDGRTGSPRIGSVITAHVIARNGSGDTWGYDLWHAQSRSDFHSAFIRLGGFSGHVQNATFQRETVGGVELVEASIPWSYSSYSYSVAVSSTSPPLLDPFLSQGCHYQLGKHGLIRIFYPLRDIRAGGGVGTLRAAPGSPLAEILGAESVTFPAIRLDLEFEGYHRIMNSPPPGCAEAA
jgi:hypothetical protein